MCNVLFVAEVTLKGKPEHVDWLVTLKGKPEHVNWLPSCVTGNLQTAIPVIHGVLNFVMHTLWSI